MAKAEIPECLRLLCEAAVKATEEDKQIDIAQWAKRIAKDFVAADRREKERGMSL